ncbi:DNA mismatch repair protein MutS [Oscillatoria sp. FACHB-1406]|uniref:DNA mismatch repair protein MutS n=1 Tax=Oscillatoria sp. FACHB-1406 TaxID=2692846 RepID=UPI0016843250|nr:DNA mismatch repair protein MutS [Oscillatoria sp. FACHB-1406]MBD2577461.1 DNA mismatch repair protein MutS [Oscillatoria sp. FACHB-1406]
MSTKANPHNDYRKIDREKLSPMMQHYVEVKETYPHALLLYRVGDFFECFFQDAVTIGQELELMMTSKESGKEIGRVAMTGVPHHAIDRYSAMLVEKGYAVVICDQTEDAAQAAAEKRMVERQVTRLLTPGTLVDDSMLSARRNNFLASVVLAKQHWGLAYADISTGEFYTTHSGDLESLGLELMRLQPAEILLPTDAPDPVGLLRPGEKSEVLPEGLPDCFCYSLRSQKHFNLGLAKERLLMKFGVRSLESMGCEDLPLCVRAAGGLLEYLEETQKNNPVPLVPLKTYAIADYLLLDPQTRRNLEILQTVRDGTYNGSLLWACDRTVTAMGGRALRRWLLQPLLDLRGIRARQDTIEELTRNTELRDSLRQMLRQIYDIERLSGRVGSGRAHAKDLANLAQSLVKLTELSRLATAGSSPYLKALHKIPPGLEPLGHHVLEHLVESPPQHLKEGGLIRGGISEILDERRALLEQDQQWVANLEISERDRTGISNLRVGYNKTFGYYISLPRSKADLAPDNYTRKQTLTNEERYITTELKERETRILNARDELNNLEYEIFCELRDRVSEKSEEIREIAKAVAATDVLAGLAEVAVTQGYCRPVMTEGRVIEIQGGRHPVVEQTLPAGFFVPNSTAMGTEQLSVKEEQALKDNTVDSPPLPVTPSHPDLIILTGPNASGKSCYLRQVGLIQLMSQIGSFVPADKATLGICDRIFTRVGAVDDLATGQSTFMVEMNETANILNHATPKSLILLDEIGRGTATFDGLSIAWAVAEYLAAEIQARTIFATHYHELNELASILANVANYQVTVKELPDKIIFLHQVRPGGADRSYGIEAGRLAGLPASVITRARQVMGQIEKHSKIALGLRKGIQKQQPQGKYVPESGMETRNAIEQLDIFE